MHTSCGIRKPAKRLRSTPAPTVARMLRRAAVEDLTFMLILLTHSHPDHIADLARLSSGTGAPIFISSCEPLRDVQTIAEGQVWNIGSLRIEARA
ncbi:MAG: MBL fold metallo-hydrolase [Geodermatophilaceae bacterium]